MKRLIILNPHSGQGRGMTRFRSLEASLRHKLGDYELYITEKAGDLTRRVRRELFEGSVDQLIIAGGDGSINEALRGYWDGEKLVNESVPLGIVNLGTGGDFYRTVTASDDDYLDALAANRMRRIDFATVETAEIRWPFLNISSVGMAGAMLIRLKKSKMQKGTLAYFYHTLRTLIDYTPGESEIEWVDLDGVTHSKRVGLVNLFACNGRASGGGMYWAPQAQLDSGHLQLTLVEDVGKWPLVTQSGKLYQGKIEEYPGTKTFAVRSARVTPDRGLSLEADGEVVVREGGGGHTQVKFQVVPGTFPLIG